MKPDQRKSADAHPHHSAESHPFVNQHEGHHDPGQDHIDDQVNREVTGHVRGALLHLRHHHRDVLLWHLVGIGAEPETIGVSFYDPKYSPPKNDHAHSQLLNEAVRRFRVEILRRLSAAKHHENHELIQHAIEKIKHGGLYATMVKAHK